MLALKAEELAEIIKVLNAHVPDMNVWAFGSRVNGTAHEGSDLDLVIINPVNPELPQTNLAELSGAFSDSNIPISIDVLDWALIPESFKEEIKKQYLVVR